MLRPMLRQWLDENMPRMIRDELDPETLRRLQD
jgi:cell pole-organizing protein PopZ